jgi:hypothetical protein
MSCDRCGFGKFIDSPIHDGQSVRRDCARCKTTLGFPVWYGRPAPTPPRNSRRDMRVGGSGPGATAAQKKDRPRGLLENCSEVDSKFGGPNDLGHIV